MDITAQIIEFENGEMDQDEILDLFQELVNTGLAWQLQGYYGRAANHLIAEGLIYYPGSVND
jgi:hypothetical protein